MSARCRPAVPAPTMPMSVNGRGSYGTAGGERKPTACRLLAHAHVGDDGAKRLRRLTARQCEHDRRRSDADCLEDDDHARPDVRLGDLPKRPSSRRSGRFSRRARSTPSGAAGRRRRARRGGSGSSSRSASVAARRVESRRARRRRALRPSRRRRGQAAAEPGSDHGALLIGDRDTWRGPAARSSSTIASPRSTTRAAICTRRRRGHPEGYRGEGEERRSRANRTRPDPELPTEQRVAAEEDGDAAGQHRGSRPAQVRERMLEREVLGGGDRDDPEQHRQIAVEEGRERPAGTLSRRHRGECDSRHARRRLGRSRATRDMRSARDPAGQRMRVAPSTARPDAPTPTATTDSPIATSRTSPCRSTKWAGATSKPCRPRITGRQPLDATAAAQRTYWAVPPAAPPARTRSADTTLSGRCAGSRSPPPPMPPS